MLRPSPPTLVSPSDCHARPTPGWRGLAVTFLLAAAFPVAVAAASAPVATAGAVALAVGVAGLLRGLALRWSPEPGDLRLPLPGGLAVEIALARR